MIEIILGQLPQDVRCFKCDWIVALLEGIYSENKWRVKTQMQQVVLSFRKEIWASILVYGAKIFSELILIHSKLSFSEESKSTRDKGWNTNM